MVRDVVCLDEVSFLSVSNDGTARKWHISGPGCLQVIPISQHYLYRSVLRRAGFDFESEGQQTALITWSFI